MSKRNPDPSPEIIELATSLKPDTLLDTIVLNQAPLPEFHAPVASMPAMESKGAYHIWTIGCQMNVADSNQVAAALERIGFRPTDAIDEADVVVLTCPLTPQTENLIDAEALERMKPGGYLINVARGRCVNEPDLIAALERGAIAGAGIDTTREEPLAPDSALWDLENALITPHTAGETRQYEDNIVDILVENVRRLQRGEGRLVNAIV